MDKRDCILLGGAGVIVAGLLWWMTKKIPYGNMQPERDVDNLVGFDAGGLIVNPYASGGNEDHYIAPNQYTGPTTILPVRYPRRAGHEVTCLIQEGYAPLYRPKPQDMKWIVQPPSEASV